MATYKYRQNLSEGASAGYVEYNITPDFGSVMALGDTFEINGRVYCGDMKRYGIAAEAALTSGGFGIELGRVEMTVSKGKSAAFSMQCYASYLLEEAAGERGFSAYLSFMLPDNADFSAGAYTTSSEDQKLSLLKERLSPEITSVTFSDATVINAPEETNPYAYFGGAVQGKSDLSADVAVQLDPLDPLVRIEFARLTLGSNTVDIPAENISGNVLHIGKLDFSGSFESFGIQVRDNKGMVGGYRGGAFEVYPYSAPRLERNGNRELAERYETVTLPNGTVVDRLSDDAQTLWANFKASVSPIGGQNTWSIWSRHNTEDGMSQWVEAYSSATEEESEYEKVFTKDKRIFLDQNQNAIQFAANQRHTVEIEIRDYFETALLRFTVEKSGGYFNVEKYGVAAGMRSTATEQELKLESAYPVYPYEGIKRCENAAYETRLELDSAFRLYSEDSGLRLMVYGNVVHLSGIITPAAAISGSTTQHVIAEIPAECAPKYPVTVLQQGTGTAIWMLRVYPATDSENPAKATFSRYRNGSSYASCAAGNFLPLDAVWIV